MVSTVCYARLRGLRLSKTGERGYDRLARHLVCRLRINRGTGNALVPEGLLDDREIDVRLDQRHGKGVLKHVGMPLIRWQPGLLGCGREHAVELAAVHFAGLLGHENVLGWVIPSLGQPGA